MKTVATTRVDIRPANFLATAAPLRSQGEPNVRSKVTAFGEQSRTSTDDPRTVLRRFPQIVLRPCADTAGRSLPRSGASDRTAFHGEVRRSASALLKSHQVAQRRLLATDPDEDCRRREQADASERAMRQALVFKAVEIQEVHHRTKNTLQIAASLLSLHAQATSSVEVRLALQQSHGRLQLLAHVHQLLYASTDGTQEILMPALLHAIGDALRQSFAHGGMRSADLSLIDMRSMPLPQ